MVLQEEYLRLICLLSAVIVAVKCDQPLPSESAASCGHDDMECPTWFHPVRSSSGVLVGCECGSSLKGIVRCIHETNSTQLLSPGYCMTVNCASGTATAVVGQCPYNYIGSYIRYHYMSLPRAVSRVNNYTCGVLNRTGLLCAHCKDGLGPAVMSYKLQCLECLESPYGWLLYVFLACFPTTLFFLFVVVFKVHATSPSLNVIVFGSQILIGTVHKNIFQYDHIDTPYRASRTLKLVCFIAAGFWNLDFFRYILPPFCVSNRLTSIHVLTLDYIVAVYPLVLIVVAYVIIQLHARNNRLLTFISRVLSWCFTPCKRVRACMYLRRKASIIHTFSTFLLLSYSKLLYISFNLLASTNLYNINGTKVSQTMLYYDGSIEYLSSTHLPFALSAILVLSTLVAIPPLLLLLYPTRIFQKCLGHCRISWHPLHAFVDTFQGYYKNGTNGTRDYRSFAGMYLILRIVFLTVNLVDVHSSWIIRIVCPLIVSLLFAHLRPYRYNWYNVLDSLFLALIALFEFWILYSHIIEIITVSLGLIYTVSAIPVIYFTLYVSYQLLKWLGLLQKCQQKLRSLGLYRSTQLPQEDTGHTAHAASNEFPHRLENPGEYQALLAPALNLN